MSLFRNELVYLANGSQVNGKCIPDTIHLIVPLTAASVSQTCFLPSSGTFQVVGVVSRFGTASASGTFDLEVAGATVAIGSGTAQLTSAVALSGTAATNVATAITTQTVIKAGSALNVVIAGTMTGLADAVLSIELQKLS